MQKGFLGLQNLINRSKKAIILEKYAQKRAMCRFLT